MEQQTLFMLLENITRCVEKKKGEDGDGKPTEEVNIVKTNWDLLVEDFIAAITEDGYGVMSITYTIDSGFIYCWIIYTKIDRSIATPGPVVQPLNL